MGTLKPSTVDFNVTNLRFANSPLLETAFSALAGQGSQNGERRQDNEKKDDPGN